MTETTSIPVSVQLSNSLVIQVEATALGGVEKVGALQFSETLARDWKVRSVRRALASNQAALERYAEKYGVKSTIVSEDGSATNANS